MYYGGGKAVTGTKTIARAKQCSMLELARINGKTIFSMIYVGDTLKILEDK